MLLLLSTEEHDMSREYGQSQGATSAPGKLNEIFNQVNRFDG